MVVSSLMAGRWSATQMVGDTQASWIRAGTDVSAGLVLAGRRLAVGDRALAMTG